MKRINLVKYGCERLPEEDFSDDGVRFYVYQIGSVRISKATSCGDIYIDGSPVRTELTYDEYSNLPHYAELGNLNGVSPDLITEEALMQFINDCKAFSDEYETRVNSLVYPTKDEIKSELDRRVSEIKKVRSEFETIYPEVLEKLVTVDRYTSSRLLDYCRYIYSEERQANINLKIIDQFLNTRKGLTLMEHKNRPVDSIEWLRRIKELVLA